MNSNKSVDLVQIQNIINIQEVFLCPFPVNPYSYPTVRNYYSDYFPSQVSFAYSRTSYIQNHTIYTLLSKASSTKHKVPIFCC